MAFFDVLIWFVLTMLIGGSVGIVFAMLSRLVLKRRDRNYALKVIQGKIPNNLELDGKKVDVNKFQYKENDGEIIKVNITDIGKKTQSEALKDEKNPTKPTQRVSFWKRKSKGKKNKK